MFSKALICSLLIFTTLTLNCLPEQFLDLRKNNCRSCQEVQFTVPGGRHSLCKCRSGYWFVLKEGRCLSENQISEIFMPKSDHQQEKALLNKRSNIRNLNQVLSITNRPLDSIQTVQQKPKEVSSPKKGIQPATLLQKKPQIQPEKVPTNTRRELVRPTKSSTVISKPVEIKTTDQMVPLKAEMKNQENIRKKN